jgi:hypothetical protein
MLLTRELSQIGPPFRELCALIRRLDTTSSREYAENTLKEKKRNDTTCSKGLSGKKTITHHN